MLWNDKKIVIEIDGPEHFAQWDQVNKKWDVSEDVYTRNLKRERKLRKEGWVLLRVSNQEVEDAEDWSDISEIIGLDELIYDESGDDYPEYYYFAE